MMRMLAWCGISQSMSASLRPALASTARAALSSTPTASLNTAWPSIFSSGSPMTLPPDTRARHAQDADMAAVGVQVAGQDAGLVAGLEHDGAGAVAEQHAGRAVVEVEDAREDLGADHQRARGRRRCGSSRRPRSARRRSPSTRPARRRPRSRRRRACAARCRRSTGRPCPASTWRR